MLLEVIKASVSTLISLTTRASRVKDVQYHDEPKENWCDWSTIDNVQDSLDTLNFSHLSSNSLASKLSSC